MQAAYYAPRDLGEALSILQSERPVVLAGGTDVFAARGQAPLTDSFLDITGLTDLRGISRTASGFRIGAAVTWTELLRADLPPAFDGLRAAAREVGSVQIQNTGTIAGNLCNASPAADGVPPLLTLEAEVELASPDGVRRLPLDRFLLGPRQTAKRADELLVALHVPAQPADAWSAFEKLGARRYLVISIAMTAVLLQRDATGRIDLVRVAVGACAPVARRLPALEAALIGQHLRDVRVNPDHLAPLAPITDVRADLAYRLDAVPEQIYRALRKAALHEEQALG